jgi:hypothetical protein
MLTIALCMRQDNAREIEFNLIRKTRYLANEKHLSASKVYKIMVTANMGRR